MQLCLQSMIDQLELLLAVKQFHTVDTEFSATVAHRDVLILDTVVVGYCHCQNLNNPFAQSRRDNLLIQRRHLNAMSVSF